MNMPNTDITNKILSALDEGVSVDALATQFPEHRAVIESISETRALLTRIASTIPEPVTEFSKARLHVERVVESPYNISNVLFLNMNYKLIAPVLVLGILAIGGYMFLPSGDRNLTMDTPEDTTPTDTSDTSNTDSSVTDTSTGSEPTTPPITPDTSVDTLLSSFVTDISNEQVAYVETGVDESVFALSALSDFESDTYDF